jgi:predicted nucleic acid-binding protein
VTRGELSLPEAETMAAALEKAGIVLRPTRSRCRSALAAACALRHPAYDCICLCLAEELAEPLVTADERLVGAVRAAPLRRFADLVLPLAELPQVLAARPEPGP